SLGTRVQLRRLHGQLRQLTVRTVLLLVGRDGLDDGWLGQGGRAGGVRPLAAQQGGEAGQHRERGGHAEHHDQAAVERAGDQRREERALGQRRLAGGWQLREDAGRREQVLYRVDAEHRGEQRGDRRQRRDLVGDAGGYADPGQPVRQGRRQ